MTVKYKSVVLTSYKFQEEIVKAISVIQLKILIDTI